MEAFLIIFFILVAAIIPFAIYYTDKQESYIKKSVKKVSEKSPSDNVQPPEVSIIPTTVLEMLQKKSQQARINSIVMIVLTIFILFVGAISFYNAADIALVDQEKKEASYNGSISDSIRTQYMIYRCDSLGLNYKELKPKWNDARIKLINIKENIDSSSVELVRQQKKIEQYVDAHYKDEILRDQLKVIAERQKYVNSDIYSKLTTFSVRLMISLLALYMSQIFLKLYRYNKNVADFYESRYISILAKTELNLEYEFAMKSFQHNFDFGDSPKNPFEMALELLKTSKDIKNGT